MKYQPYFVEAKTKEEKLIVELSKNLQDTMFAHIQLNMSYCTEHEIFLTLRGGSINFVVQTICALLHCLSDNLQKPIFLRECQSMFNSCIEEKLKELG